LALSSPAFALAQGKVVRGLAPKKNGRTQLIKRLLLKRIEAAERDLGVPADYVKDILRVSLPAFLRFAAFTPLSAYRRKLPAAPCAVARIVAIRSEDCGPCVQIGVNLARRDGVAPEILRAVLDRKLEDLPEELAEVYHFTEAVLEKNGQDGPLRERMRKRYGEEGLVELALAIASCRVFPATKWALGYAVSCERVEVQV
jgi:alkylhydroperoxidase family enzyme